MLNKENPTPSSDFALVGLTSAAHSFWSSSVQSAEWPIWAVHEALGRSSWMNLITPLQTAECWSPTHCSDRVSFGRPQRPAHPRFPQNLQVIGIALDEKHGVLQPSLEGNFRHRFHESFIPEASQILRFKVRKHILSAGAARAVFAVLVPTENNSERRGWQLDQALLYRHFCLQMNLFCM